MSGVLSKSNFQFGENNFDVIVFKNEDGYNESYLIAKKVAEALGYADPGDAVRTHCPDRIEYRTLIQRGGQITHPFLSQPQTNLISEGDVYGLIFASQLPLAKEFRSFVFNVVLKSIRTFGCYPPPGKIPELPETQQQHHLKEVDRIEVMTDKEKKVENKYKKIELRTTMNPDDIEKNKRSAKKREDNRRNASKLLASLILEKEEWEELQRDYEEALGLANQNLYDKSRAVIKLSIENKQLREKLCVYQDREKNEVHQIVDELIEKVCDE